MMPEATNIHTTHIMHAYTDTQTHTQTHARTHALAMHICAHWTPHVHLCVSIHVAPPLVMEFNSEEIGSDIKISWKPPGLENGEYFYRLSVSFRSTFSDRSEEGSFVQEFARIGPNSMPFSSFFLRNTSDDDNRQQVAASNTLMHRIRSSASYDFSLAGVNRLFSVPSVLTMSTLTTSPTRK